MGLNKGKLMGVGEIGNAAGFDPVIFRGSSPLPPSTI